MTGLSKYQKGFLESLAGIRKNIKTGNESGDNLKGRSSYNGA